MHPSNQWKNTFCPVKKRIICQIIFNGNVCVFNLISIVKLSFSYGNSYAITMTEENTRISSSSTMCSKEMLYTFFPVYVYKNMEGKQNCHIRDIWHCSVKIMPILYSKIELSKECTHFCGLCQEFVPLQLHCNATVSYTHLTLPTKRIV